MTTAHQTAIAPPEAEEELIHPWSIRLLWHRLAAALKRSTDRSESRRALRHLPARTLRDLGLRPDDLDWL